MQQERKTETKISNWMKRCHLVSLQKKRKEIRQKEINKNKFLDANSCWLGGKKCIYCISVGNWNMHKKIVFRLRAATGSLISLWFLSSSCCCMYSLWATSTLQWFSVNANVMQSSSSCQKVVKQWSVWQYGLRSFQTGGTKLERFLPKNQQTQRKLWFLKTY